jgi:phage terminase small subunit
MVSRLSKADIQEMTETIPVSSLLGKGSGQALTAKQKKFAREIVKGKSKAQAYREAYKRDATKSTLASAPYVLAADARVAQEIAALEAAERAQAYRTPSRLRALVVETLAQVATDTSQRTSDRLRAAQLIGQITEVAAFTERKEVHNISSSSAARSRVLQEIKQLMAASDDVTDVQAKSLLDELTQGQEQAQGGNVATTPADTLGQYDDSQVIDSIRDDDQQQPEGMQKNRKSNPETGVNTGGGMS